MAHIKIVSFTSRGAETGERIAKVLGHFLVEESQRSEDVSLAASSIERFAQQAMVDCDLLIFISEIHTAVRAIARYTANNGYDPMVLCADESLCRLVQILDNENFRATADQIAERLGVPLFK